MFQARLNDEKSERFVVGDTSVDLISARSWFVFEGPGFGWGLSYQRPVRVESSRDTVSIRDHVMVTRVAAVAVALVLAIRRFLN